MTSHVLDRPVWSALTTRQACFAEGGVLARRYRRGIIPFAATAREDPASVHELSRLLRADETLMLVQADPIVVPPDAEAILAVKVVQMVSEKPLTSTADAEIAALTDADAEQMLELATLTQPGPFTLRAASLGDFFGIKERGRLVAMAGERMRQVGFAELSGVCSHPDFRGKGFARRLSVHVASRIAARGETPVLHAYERNFAAIRLYESIGFRVRSTLNVAVIRKRMP